MAGSSGLRQGKQKYSDLWNAENAARRLKVLEARVDESGTVIPATGDFFGQKFFKTTTGKWYAWNGTTWDILN